MSKPNEQILMSPRHKAPVPVQHPWPDHIQLLQGGESGLVFVRGGQDYTTAFVEAFSPNTGFVRGEGATIAEAEDDAWAKAQKYLACPGHEWEARGYTNGGGICKHCGRFGSDVFTAEQLGQFCAGCGVPTKWHEERHQIGEETLVFWVCENHTPERHDWICRCASCVAKLNVPITDDDIAAVLGALGEEPT